MTKEQLNEKALKEYENLKAHSFFEDLEIIENNIKANKNKMDYEFYLAEQDELNYLYGELENTYSELNADLERYLVNRTVEIIIDSGSRDDKSVTLDGQDVKITATTLNNILSKIIKGEVEDLYHTVLILESKVKRVINNLQTVRNHTYVKKESQNERD